MLPFVVIPIVSSILIFFIIAGVLILSDPPRPLAQSGEHISFQALVDQDYSDLPELQPFRTRSGGELRYRAYPALEAKQALILLHGSAWHGMQFHPMAKAISASGLAHVIVPDLRGHGFAPQRRGDVDYIGQFEDDLADLIDALKMQFPAVRFIVGGHSSGGGLAIRFAGGVYGARASAYLLMAPFIKHDAPTTRPNSGGWSAPQIRRIIGLVMLNAAGIRIFNGLTVIQFNMPQTVLQGMLGPSATTAYSYRLNTSFAPRDNYGRDLAALSQPFLLIAGTADEAFVAEQYEPTISQYTQSGAYLIVPEVSHIGMLTSPAVETAIIDWLRALPA